MSSVLVVVIVGVIVVAITAASIADGPKPATPDQPAHRAPDPPEPQEPPPEPLPEPHAELLPSPIPEPTAPVAWVPPERPRVEPVAPGHPAHLREEAPLDDRGFLRRLRSTLLLGVAVVVLGAIAAGVLGGLVYLGAHVVGQALG